MKYSEIITIKEYKQYLEALKQEILLYLHLKFTLDEIITKLKDEYGIEKEIVEIIMEYIKQILKEETLPLIKTKDENLLRDLWFKQYLIFGKDVKTNVNHYPDLIIFKFQKKEIKKLIDEFKDRGLIEFDSSDIVERNIKELLKNKYKSYTRFKVDFFNSFKINIFEQGGKEILNFPKEHNFGNFLNKKIIWGGFEQRAINIFVIRLRYIIFGGQYYPELNRYMPFFMADSRINEDIKKYLEARLKAIIEKYYNNLNTPIIIPKAFPTMEKFKYLFEIPPVTMKLFEVIDWDFMSANGFWDGLFMPKEERGLAEEVLRSYIINLHPIPLFYTYFNRKDFQPFIDQLLHHEWIHIMQIMFAIISDLLYSKSNPFKDEKEFNYVLKRAKLRWIEEKKPSYFTGSLMEYIGFTGGHWDFRTNKPLCFMKEVNKFEPCQKAMELRGKAEAIYNALFWKLYGKTMGEAKWFMCNPKVSSEIRSKAKCD